jgi:nucleoid-associated protein YgaU
MTQTSKTSGLIRMGLMGTAFIALTIVLLVFQPGSTRKAQVLPDPETETRVTREAAPLDTVAPPVEPTQDIVTAAPQPAITLGPTADEPTNMRDLTFSAISNLKAATTGEAPAPGEPGSLLHSVVQRSIANTTRPQVTEIEPVRADTSRTPTVTAYFVRPGDTLMSIAEELYGDVNMSTAIFQANTDTLSRPDSLQAGMVLKLPDE